MQVLKGLSAKRGDTILPCKETLQSKGQEQSQSKEGSWQAFTQKSREENRKQNMNYPQTCWFLSKPNRTEVKDETHLRSDPEPKVLRQSLDARKPPAFLLTPRPQAWLRLTAGSTAIHWVTPHHLNQAVQSHELQHTTVWVFSAHLQSIAPKIQGKISWESKPLSRKIFKIRMFKIISLKKCLGF